jgi:SAM-dependent methyltransferase
MVARCRDKGVDARVMELMQLDLPLESFDAVYAMNCLLHIPNVDLPTILGNIRAVMRSGALFFLGVFGGDGYEGPLEHDDHVPPRFFSFRTDEQLRDVVGDFFDIADFHVIRAGEFLFQSMTLRPA